MFWNRLIHRCPASFSIGRRKLSIESSSVPSVSSSSSNSRNLPVLGREVERHLNPKDGDIFLDLTFGMGGHTRQILSSGKDVRVVAIDRDPVSFQKATQLSMQEAGRVIPVLGRFSEVPDLLPKLGIKHNTVKGVTIDLGPSIAQLENPERGFDINVDSPLDLRMDGSRFPDMATAGDVVNTLDSDMLAKIFRQYGEEKLSKKIGQSIVDARFMMHSIKTSKQLVQLISSIVGNEVRLDVLNRPSSSSVRVLQALRMFVNNELNELNYIIEKIRPFLLYDPNIMSLKLQDKEGVIQQDVQGGVLSIIAFNTVEDTVVKDHFLSCSDEEISPYYQRPINVMEMVSSAEMDKVLHRKWFPLEKFVLFPGEEEVLSNLRTKNARLRSAMRRQ